MHSRVVLHTFIAVYFLAVSTLGAQERVLRAELDLANPVDTVWTWWTTEAGIRSFFAAGARIDPKVDGELHVLFSPDSPPGQRGAEGLRIVAFEPPRRLLFTWNAPPELPDIRAQRTVVEVRLEPSPRGGTRLTFLHWGWGTGPQWDKAYEYFDTAWNSFVLPGLMHRDAHGPIDWKKPPQLKPLFRSLKHDLCTQATGPK
jgi:uncharacterized protein YndB with AHSA1/START domain